MILTKDHLINYDVIIVGSGFASLPIIESLSKKTKILLITGGGDKGSETSLNRSLTESEGYGHFPSGYFASHWVRSFGGTSSRWSGWTATLNRNDFEESSNSNKWPIRYEELRRYYVPAAVFLGKNPITVEFEQPVAEGEFIYKPFSTGNPRRLIESYDEIQKYSNVNLLENFQLIGLISNERTSINGLVMCNQDGARQALYINTKQKIVLACGGLGNAQILLQPQKDCSIAVGNESGVVGHYLMEHPHTQAAEALIDLSFIPSTPKNFGGAQSAFMINDSAKKMHNLLGCTLSIQKSEFTAERNFLQYFENKFNKKLSPSILYARSEQEPSSMNRVELTPEINWAGMRMLTTHCTFSTRDLLSIEKTTRLFGEMIAKNGYGILKISNDSIYRNAGGGGHTMGTTRMGSNPKNSVCDSENRVHGYSNLYLSGSSTFTTGGASNPTLTIVAMAIRLGNILNRDLTL